MRKYVSLLLALMLCLSTACKPGMEDIATNETTVPSVENTEIVDTAPSDTQIQDPTTPAPTSAQLKAHFIDVGQADSILIQLPNEEIMLIDAGGDVRNYIRNLGIQKIDYLIATHPHSDHIAYMEEIVRGFEIGAIYMPRVSHTSKTFENMLLAIQEKGLTIKTAKAGVSILAQDELSVNIVAPVGSGYKSMNDYSAVVKVTHKETSMLFMGDAETLSENQITADVDADVIKIGHHGSTTSSGNAFLNKVSPEIAVISCGTGNSYGHPHAETLQKLESRNIQIYRTDISGTIIITSDGKSLQVDTKNATTAEATEEETTQTTDTTNAGNDAVVYITRTGKRYHREGCSGLSNSKIPSTVEEAKAKGLTPCQNCKP